MTSSYSAGGSWLPATNIGNYSTAVDTRSLSISSFNFANDSSGLGSGENSTNLALLFFENPNGKVSALLHRSVFTEKPQGELFEHDQWIDITSQESKALPKEFHNPPGFDSSNSSSRTLYEADPNGIYEFNTPFLSAPWSDGFVGAMFYTPFNLTLSYASPVAGNGFYYAGYKTSLNGSGDFDVSPIGEHFASPYTERSFCEITFILDFIGPPKDYVSCDYVSCKQSDIAVFGNQSYSAIWINGTQSALITAFSPKPTLPSNEFPFKRLASVTSTDGSITYLYHQMNGTTFAEEQWDDTMQIWLPTEYITVSYP